jgi:hypothetical protein
MPNGRCCVHGGPSTGPRTEEGKAKIRASRTKHGRYSQASIAARRSATVLLRQRRTDFAGEAEAVDLVPVFGRSFAGARRCCMHFPSPRSAKPPRLASRQMSTAPSCFRTCQLDSAAHRLRDPCFVRTRFRCTNVRWTGNTCGGPGSVTFRPTELLPVGGDITVAFLFCQGCLPC